MLPFRLNLHSELSFRHDAELGERGRRLCPQARTSCEECPFCHRSLQRSRAELMSF
jgi:hypothetical protein